MDSAPDLRVPLESRNEGKPREVNPKSARWRVTVAEDALGWWVRLEGSGQMDRYPNVTQAIHRGRKLAHQNKPSCLVVHHASGVEELAWFED